MSRFTSALLLALSLGGSAVAADLYPGIGRTALPAEIAAWDIDVRPDFKGLPPGRGSVAEGQVIWDNRCASCHGTFGESNEVFSPIVGGTTAEDIRVGRVKALQEPVARTTFMKVSAISTLWDYIHRAMPWNAPKSLKTDEVYAVLAYMLNLADIVPEGFVLDEKTIRDVQNRLPNRNGKVKYEGLWSIASKGDVQNTACMSGCKVEIGLASFLPDFARGTHGNLAEQQRLVGPARGLDTEKPAAASGAVPVAVAKPKVATLDLATKSNCMTCHQIDKKIVGPSFNDVTKKYKDDPAAEGKLMEKVKRGGSGAWGSIPMPPNALKEEDLRTLVKWVLAGSPGK